MLAKDLDLDQESAAKLSVADIAQRMTTAHCHQRNRAKMAMAVSNLLREASETSELAQVEGQS